MAKRFGGGVQTPAQLEASLLRGQREASVQRSLKSHGFWRGWILHSRIHVPQDLRPCVLPVDDDPGRAAHHGSAVLGILFGGRIAWREDIVLRHMFAAGQHGEDGNERIEKARLRRGQRGQPGHDGGKSVLTDQRRRAARGRRRRRARGLNGQPREGGSAGGQSVAQNENARESPNGLPSLTKAGHRTGEQGQRQWHLKCDMEGIRARETPDKPRDGEGHGGPEPGIGEAGQSVARDHQHGQKRGHGENKHGRQALRAGPGTVRDVLNGGIMGGGKDHHILERRQECAVP